MRGPNTQIESKFPPIKTIADMLVEAQTANSDVFSTIDIQHVFFSIKYKVGDTEPTTFYADCGTAVSSLPIKYYLSEAYNDIYDRDLGTKPKVPIRDHRSSRNVDNYYSDSEGETVEDLEF